MMRLRLKFAVVTNQIKKDMIQQFGNSEGFPTDPDEQEAFLKSLDALVPQNQKTKIYIKYLCDMLFSRDIPGFELPADAGSIRMILHDFDELCTKNKITGADAQLTIKNYNEIGLIDEKIKQIKNLQKPKLEEGKDSLYTPEQEAVVNAGATLLYRANGWKVYKCEHTDKGMSAATMLCDNATHDVRWCVGQGRNYAEMYISKGPFYVFQHHGLSTYAINTNFKSGYQPYCEFTNRPNAIIWRTTSTDADNTSFRSLREANPNFNPGMISSLPVDLIPILKVIQPKDKELKITIPETNFKEDPKAFKELDTAILAANKEALVKDINSCNSQRSLGMATAVISRCIALHYQFEWSKFQEIAMLMYIELYAGTGKKDLPASLNSYIMSELEAKN